MRAIFRNMNASLSCDFYVFRMMFPFGFGFVLCLFSFSYLVWAFPLPSLGGVVYTVRVPPPESGWCLMVFLKSRRFLLLSVLCISCLSFLIAVLFFHYELSGAWRRSLRQINVRVASALCFPIEWYGSLLRLIGFASFSLAPW